MDYPNEVEWRKGMFQSSAQHVTEDQLEKYMLQQVSEPASAAVEEHLLVCHQCQEQLEKLEIFTSTIRSVAPVLDREDRLAAVRPGLGQRFFDWIRSPLPALAFGAAALLAVVLVPMSYRAGAPGGPPVTLELQAIRAASFPEAPAGRPLLLRIELAGLTPAASYRAELASDSGDVLLTRSLPAVEPPLALLPVEKTLPVGRYWLRLYGTDHAEPIREFGFLIR